MGEEGYGMPVFFAEVPGLLRERSRGEDTWRICKMKDVPPKDGKFITLAATWNDQQLAALAGGGVEKGRCRRAAAQLTQAIARFLLNVCNSRRAPNDEEDSQSTSGDEEQ